MSSPKNHHFVPVVYLKSWTNEHDGQLFRTNIEHGRSKKHGPKGVAYQKFLYKLSDKLSKSDNQVDDHKVDNLFGEKTVVRNFEDSWSKSGILNVMDVGGSILEFRNLIVNFIALQYMRTPTTLDFMKRYSDELGKIADGDFLVSNILINHPKIRRSFCQVIKFEGPFCFVTSDNPAWHWVREGNTYFVVDTDNYQGAMLQPEFCIVMSLHPKYLAIIYPNIQNESIEQLPATLDDIHFFNNLIKKSAQSYIYHKFLDDYPT